MVAAITKSFSDMYNETTTDEILDIIPVEELNSIEGGSVADMPCIIITKSDGSIHKYIDDFDNHYKVDFFI